jgi:hypothetical protein
LFIWLWDRIAMKTRGVALGPASTRFNDYIGTVAADDAEVIKDRPSLYELAQIDRDRYTIVGIDLTVDGPTTATIYAIDRIEQAVARQAEIVEAGDSWGEISVTPFDIPEPNVEDFLTHAFRRISVRLVTQRLRDQLIFVIKPGSVEGLDA